MCVCLCVSLISDFSGTGRHSATLLTPSWRASSGELHQLLLDLTGRFVREGKLLEPFRM